MIPRLLRELPNFRRYWTGQTVSLVGDQISLIAVPLVAVLALHAGPAQMGYLTASILAPNLLFALHLGAWIDRRGRRRQAMIAADIGRGLLLATIPAAYALGLLTFAQLLVVGFLVGTLSVLFSVSEMTLFTSIVPRERFVEANQLLHGSRAFSYVSGLSVGGVLVQLLTAPLAVLADALSYGVSALYLRRVEAVEPPTDPPAPGQLVAGARFIARTPLLRAGLASFAIINFFNFAFQALFVLYATRDLEVPPAALGIVMGAASVGTLLGSFVTGALVKRAGLGPTLVIGSLLFTAPLLLVPLAGGAHVVVLALLFLSEFVSGFGVMLLDIAAGTVHQAIVPDRLRSRVTGAHMLVNNGVRPIGSLLGGALGAVLGMRSTLWLVAAAALLGVVILLPSPVPRLRALPEPAE